MGGFLDLRGRPISAKDVEENKLPSSYNWFPDEGSDRLGYRIRFMWPRGVERPSSFTFVFYNSSTNPFTEKEWRKFFEWKDVHLAKVFPDATMEVTQHPAEFTKKGDLLRISNNTGIPIPERYRSNATES